MNINKIYLSMISNNKVRTAQKLAAKPAKKPVKISVNTTNSKKITGLIPGSSIIHSATLKQNSHTEICDRIPLSFGI